MKLPLRPSDLSLAHLGLSDAGPLALIEAAAAAGFRAVGLPLRSGALKPLAHPIVGNAALVRDIQRACRDTSVTIFDAESLVLGAEGSEDELRRCFETAADIGASRMSCLGPEHRGDTARGVSPADVERLAAIASIAGEFGLRIGIEFMLFRTIRTLGDARATVEAAGADNLSIIVDALHLFRSGGSAAEVAALPANLISHVQICDAPREAPADLTDEARAGRLLPGSGAIPLAPLVAAAREAPLALEIPIRANAHLSVAERIKRAADALASFT